ncbi:MAG: curli production assembly protein CsgG [Bryobacteraceae bacterium]|nr:curli production assembly protein CsgG [Bryobacteraceae bacterium]
MMAARRLTAVALLIGFSLAMGQPQQKRRVAVLNFDYGTIRSGVAAIFGTDVDVGTGISDMLVEELVKGGSYSVIERKALDKILAEQNFSNSDRADPATAARIGRLLGVDAIIVGSITQFGRDDRNVGLGGFGRSLGKYGLGGTSVRSAKAVVAVTARLVNVETGEVLAVATGNGESKRSGTSLLGAGGSSGAAGGGVVDMRSTNFANTILGEATRNAVQQLAQQLNANAGRIEVKARPIEGLVADVSGSTVVINVGTRAGVRPGMVLSVRRVGREIKDPATGRVIRRVEETLGTLTITEADEESAVGTFTGAAAPKVGDTVKN